MNTVFHAAHVALYSMPSHGGMARPAVWDHVPNIPPGPPDIPPDIDEPEFPDTPVPPVQDPPPQPQPIIGYAL